MIFPPLSVMDKYFFGRQQGPSAGQGAARNGLQAVRQHFGFDLVPDALTGSLTIGERQQLEIVRLLAHGRAGDHSRRAHDRNLGPQKVLLFETLRRLASEGLSVIFVSHKLDEVEALSSQVTGAAPGAGAGNASAPLCAGKPGLEMMFGQCRSPATGTRCRRGDVVLEDKDVSVHTYRLDVSHGRFRCAAARSSASPAWRAAASVR